MMKKYFRLLRTQGSSSSPNVILLVKIKKIDSVPQP